jgi:hypothetical protein
MYLWVYQGKRIDLPNIGKDKGKQEANATSCNFQLKNYECESNFFERKPLLVQLS